MFWNIFKREPVIQLLTRTIDRLRALCAVEKSTMAFEAGYTSYADLGAVPACPYDADSKEAKDWLAGRAQADLQMSW